MRKSKSSISNATSYEEIGEFWDSHDLSDYWDKTKPVDLDIDISSEVTYYPVEADLLELAEHVNGSVLWANLHLLFWLSLTPFVTNWMGENQFAAWPVALYGGVLCAAIAYFILVRTLLSLHGLESVLATALGRDFKG